MRSHIGKRTASAACIILTTALALAACSSNTSTGSHGNSGTIGGQITIGDWGGTFANATKVDYAQPFTKATGVKVTFANAPGEFVPQLEQQAASNNITWDLIDSVNQSDVSALVARHLLQPLPAKLRSYLQRYSLPGAVTKYGIVDGSGGDVVVCNPRLAKRCPTNIKQFFNVAKYPGPRVLYNLATVDVAAGAEAYGATKGNMYPINIKAAFAELVKIKPSVKLWTGSGNQFDQAMRSGEAVMGIFTAGRAHILKTTDMPYLKVAWNGLIYGPGYYIIPRGAPNLPAAYAYLKWYATHAAAQAKWATTVGYGVPSKEAYQKMAPAVAASLAQSHMAVAIPMNAAWDAKHYNQLTRLWQQEIGS